MALASVAYALLVACFALYVVRWNADERFTSLFSDNWQNLAGRAEQPFARWLFSSHNGHLIPDG